MNDLRKALLALLAAGIVFSALAAALVTHALVAFSGSDYGTHAHGSLPIVVTGALCAGAGALALYVAHIVSAGRRSLPSLARELQRHLGWRFLIAIVVTACATLAGMELAEQAAAHRFDGLLSPFGDCPLLGFVSIIAASGGLALTARAMCAWLAHAHDKIVQIAFALLAIGVNTTDAAIVRPRRISARYTFNARAISRLFGKRAPPAFLAS